jgi:two-component system sensor histidine kinase PhoQ
MVTATKRFFNSLKNRVIFSAILMVFILLPLVGFTISNAYEKHMIAGIENELTAYSYSILATVDVDNDKIEIPEYLLENQFNVNQSGLYAIITELTTPNKKNLNLSIETSTLLWQSLSMLTVALPKDLAAPAVGDSKFYQRTLANVPYFIFSLSVSYTNDNSTFPITLHIAKQQNEWLNLMTEFHQKLILGLAVLMTILLLFQYLWSMWTLKPLTTLRHELSDVEQGKSDSLRAHYPDELVRVTEQLNVLLKSEQQQRQRYRNSLSDLAHGLKTPLAVMQSSETMSVQSQEQIDVMNAMIEHQLKKAQSAGQSSWHLGITVKPVSDKLINSLQKIYQEKNLTIISSITDDIIFKGDEADLFEILGNILDNACKAARNKVSISCLQSDINNGFIVEDDGDGIAPQLREEILQRGTRADTYQQGHGIGLSIVRDLVTSYQGTLTIADSNLFGGAKFTLQFSR